MSPQREGSSKRLVCTGKDRTRREEAPKHSGSPPAPNELKGDENRILILWRAFAMHKRERMGDWHAAHLIFSLPNYLFPSLHWSSRLFCSSLWPQLFFPIFFSVPLSHFFLLLFLHFLTENIFLLLFSFSKIILTRLKLHFYLRKSWEEKKPIISGRSVSLLQSSDSNWHCQAEQLQQGL